MHMLPTAMKKAMTEVDNANEGHAVQMLKDWKAVQEVVVYVKRTGKNLQLPLGFALEVELESRFGMVCKVTKLFIKSADKNIDLLDNSPAKEFYSIYNCMQDDGTSKYPHLLAIVQCLCPIRHI